MSVITLAWNGFINKFQYKCANKFTAFAREIDDIDRLSWRCIANVRYTRDCGTIIRWKWESQNLFRWNSRPSENCIESALKESTRSINRNKIWSFREYQSEPISAVCGGILFSATLLKKFLDKRTLIAAGDPCRDRWWCVLHLHADFTIQITFS